MGTHATIRFNEVVPFYDTKADGTYNLDDRGQPIILEQSVEATGMVMYIHYDGYEEGVGAQLASVIARGTDLSPRREGQLDRRVGTSFFDFGCFLATVVADFKDQPGNQYLYPDRDMDYGVEYEYEVTYDRSCHTQAVPWLLTMHHKGQPTFSGSSTEFLNRYAPSVLETLTKEKAVNETEVRQAG